MVSNKSNYRLITLHKKTDDLEIAQYFLDQGADIESKDKDGRSALFLAAKEGKADILELLIEVCSQTFFKFLIMN